MAKDPAILFYTSDFLTGTMLMSHEQVGIYIRLLCVMHQHGGTLDLAAFNAFIGKNDILRKKFVVEDGVVFNERLMLEMAKRAKKSSSLSANAKIRWKKRCKSNAIACDLQMPIEDERIREDALASASGPIITNININKVKKIALPTLEEVKAYCLERKNNVDPEKWHAYYTSNGWKVGKNPMKNWRAAVITWEKSEFNKPIINDGIPEEWKTKKTQYHR